MNCSYFNYLAIVLLFTICQIKSRNMIKREEIEINVYPVTVINGRVF